MGYARGEVSCLLTLSFDDGSKKKEKEKLIWSKEKALSQDESKQKKEREI